MSQSKNDKPQRLQRNDIPEKKKTTKHLTCKLDEVGKKGAEAGVSEDHCLDCGKLVSDTQDGLVCDVCGFWYHCECEKVSEEIYEFLHDHEDNTSIAWYCKKCSVTSRKFMGLMSTMNEQHQQVEEKLSQLDKNIKIRMDEMMSDMKNQIDDLRITLNKSQDKAKTWSSVVAVEEKMDKIIAAVEKQDNNSHVQSMEGKVNKIIETMEKQNIESHEVMSAVAAFRNDLHEDKDEMMEVKKRSRNIIIHGLNEPVSEVSRELRKKSDEDKLTELLHHIGCDEVSIQEMVRLGKFDDKQGVPRPVMVVTASETQRDKVINRAKNLKRTAVKSFEKVFVHQDLTPKQRKLRQQLVREMKQRQASGEPDLILINNKIVTRRPTPTQNTVLKI